jgi:hypothetical protein
VLARIDSRIGKKNELETSLMMDLHSSCFLEWQICWRLSRPPCGEEQGVVDVVVAVADAAPFGVTSNSDGDLHDEEVLLPFLS